MILIPFKISVCPSATLEIPAAVNMDEQHTSQDGDIQYDRLKHADPEALMRHLYYDCMQDGSGRAPSLEQAALKSYDTNQPQDLHDDQQQQLFCPRRFDGWTCWDAQPAGTVAENYCPNFVLGFDANRLAFRVCNTNGSWFVHPESGREWSNYTNCVDLEDMKFRRLVNDLYIGGYTISLVTLIVSLCVFFSFRTLKCTRIRIHINLFISLALSCIFWLVWYKLVVEQPEVTHRSGNWCISLHILLHYLMLVNYFWMFCEGLHLHLVLVIVFIKDAIAMRWFMTIGWIVPMGLISFYATFRNNYTADTEHCWMDESHAMWLLTVPVFLSLAASLVFLVNVVRVLLTKLNSTSPNPAPLGLKKATRATLILVASRFLLLLAPLVTSRCAANETYRRVGRPCGKSCGTYGQLCAMKRINRCQCLVGFARNRSGACIYHKHCPVNLQDAEFLEFV
ncbi:calcitonin receptor [Culex quinquefasciatus]|uniref:Calcitonin receptor n=1 Tax=Culex quinquefasciatus TaxID=7176 RepID=B0WXR4_CULQU|nr:calcitonin receptor [Culex quinquefasciatus]|eukprot:XP_001862186.1 calcitonin receptor [Culex quinquefasciatus]